MLFVLAALNETTRNAGVGNGAWSTIGPRIVGLVIVTLVIVWVGVFIVEWSRRRKSTHSTVRQSSLFDQLCATHNLDADAQRLLEEIANRDARGDLVLPFVDPRILERVSHERPELATIGRQLFGPAWQP